MQYILRILEAYWSTLGGFCFWYLKFYIKATSAYCDCSILFLYSMSKRKKFEFSWPYCQVFFRLLVRNLRVWVPNPNKVWCWCHLTDLRLRFYWNQQGSSWKVGVSTGMFSKSGGAMPWHPRQRGPFLTLRRKKMKNVFSFTWIGIYLLVIRVGFTSLTYLTLQSD